MLIQDRLEFGKRLSKARNICYGWAIMFGHFHLLENEGGSLLKSAPLFFQRIFKELPSIVFIFNNNCYPRFANHINPLSWFKISRL